MASVMFDSTTKDIGSGAIALEADTFYVMLVNGYTPNARTHAKRSDVTNEATGTGYPAGGQALASIVGTLDNTTNDRTRYTCVNPVFTTTTTSATGAVVYKHRGGASSADNLVSYIDFGGTVSSTAATFTITSFSSSGFIDINKV